MIKTTYSLNFLNYNGNKERIKNFINENLPQNIDTVVDVFGGSGLMSLNTNIHEVVYNEKSKHLCRIMEVIKNYDISDILECINDVIEKYNLGKLNKQEYLNLRKDFNKTPTLYEVDDVEVIKLMCLIFYSFNHQIVINKNGGFSVPSGYNRSNYTDFTEQKLINFKKKIDDLGNNFTITNYNFADCIGLLCFREDSILFMVDPPYFASDHSYGRSYNAKWTSLDEQVLYKKLCEIHENGHKFMLTNFLSKDGVTNGYLQDFLCKNKKFRVIETPSKWNNCNYQRKNKGITKEIMVVNY